MNAMMPHPVAASAGAIQRGEGLLPFSADELMRMAETGGLAAVVGKLELNQGVITRMNPPNLPHFAASRSLTFDLQRRLDAIGSTLIAGQELGVRLSDATVRVPDVCVLAFPDGEIGLAEPGSIRIVVEVADASLAYDLSQKAHDYAAAGIPDYWVVDVRARVVHLHTEPTADGYTARRVARFGEAFDSAALGTFTIEG